MDLRTEQRVKDLLGFAEAKLTEATRIRASEVLTAVDLKTAQLKEESALSDVQTARHLLNS